ncbi:hypothetical protein I317_07787 [Kwoniella heveanensis CBS 569]|nr:hypothetical protein I317_07787 [Kwoniella heveanensis CBS 569]
MFTPLSKGSERAQDKLWETRADRTHSPRKIRVRPPIPTAGPSTAQPSSNVASSSAVPLPAKGDVKGKGKAKLLGGELRGVASGLAVGPRYKRKPRRMSGVEMEEKEGWAKLFFRPSRMTVERWLSSWWKRHFVLVVLPCIAVWVWVAIPFPVSDPYKDDPFPDIPSWPKRPKGDDPSVPSEDDPADDSGSNLPLDANFYFFLFWYVFNDIKYCMVAESAHLWL